MIASELQKNMTISVTSSTGRRRKMKFEVLNNNNNFPHFLKELRCNNCTYTGHILHKIHSHFSLFHLYIFTFQHFIPLWLMQARKKSHLAHKNAAIWFLKSALKQDINMFALDFYGCFHTVRPHFLWAWQNESINGRKAADGSWRLRCKTKLKWWTII